MKKSILVGFMMLIVGLLLTGYAYLNNGENLINAKNWEIGFLKDSKRKVMLVKNIKFSKVSVNGDLNIIVKKGTKFGVVYQGEKKDQPTVKIKDDLLSIDEHKRHGVNITISNSTNEQAIITVPTDSNLQEFSGDIGFGNFKAENMKIKRMNLSSGDGDIALAENQIDYLKINNQDGDIGIINHNKIKQGFIIMEDGDLMLKDSQLNKTTIINANGDIDVNDIIVNDVNFKLQEGDFTANNLKVLHKLNVTNSDGDNEVKLKKNTDILIGMHNEDGDNTYLGKNVGADYNTQGKTSNYIILNNNSGDNEIK